MKTKTTLTAFLIILSTFLNAQNFEWVKIIETANMNRSYIDLNGNIYMTGVFNGTNDFDPGAGVYNLTSAGEDDIFVQKLDASGNFVWARCIGGSTVDNGHFIEVDDIGNVYVLGLFSGIVDFDPGTGITNLDSANDGSSFVLKLDSSGNFLWVRAFEILGLLNAYLGSDAIGNIYFAGSFFGTVDFDPGVGTTAITSAGFDDCFVLKMDTDGNFLWAIASGGTNSDLNSFMRTDELGNIYIIGFFSGIVDFDPGPATYNLTSGIGSAFALKLDADGNFLWAFSLGESVSLNGFTPIQVDASGNIYIAGIFHGSTDFDPGSGTELLSPGQSESIFILKLDASSNFLWVKSIDSDYAHVIDVHTDSFGNVYTLGSFQSYTDFDPGSGIASFYPIDWAFLPNFFIHKLDASGNFQWVKTMLPSVEGVAVQYCIGLDSSGNVYTTGQTSGVFDFDLGTGLYLNSVASGSFVHKMSGGAEVRGYVFVDINANGLMDDGEIPVPYQSISYYNDSDVVITNESGFFKVFPPAGNQEFNYQLPSYYISTTPVTQTVDVEIGVVDTLYFGITSISDANDLVVEIHPYDSPRPGFTRNYLLTYQNAGTTTLDDVVLKYLKSMEDDVLSATGNYIVSNDTLIWNVGTLEPYASGSFTITQILSASAVMGNYTHTQAWILPTTDDETPQNNPIALDEEIMASYDPNDKSVTPEVSEPTENEPLEYTIRFQNTGNFPATFVVVVDTLDVQLDLSTFQIIAASHAYEFEIINRIATWHFPEIYLPDSLSDEAGSHGFIKFKVQRIDGLGVGAQIPNSVAIYFDYNEPVITNTCIYSIESCTSTSTDVQTACNSYTWIDGNTYTSSNNSATYVIDNAAGCDSIITLNLTITGVSNIGTTLNGATITANNNNATYQWLDCDNNNAPIMGATSQTYTATESGNYAVQLTENGCTSTSSCVAVNIIGIDESNNALQATVYPNPSQGTVELTLGKTMQDVELVLTDVQGKVVFKRNYPSLFSTEIELPDAKGVYFLKINAPDSTSTLKLVKE